MKNNSTLFAVLKEVMRGKSVSRTFTNLYWNGEGHYAGDILDMGGGGSKASHYRFLNIAKDAKIKTVDLERKPGTDFTLDITKEHVPLPATSQDVVFLFNTLEHLSGHDFVMKEIARLLRSGGKLIGTIPFLINVHADPHDYFRLTDEALRQLFLSHGFSVQELAPVGRGPFLAAYSQLESVTPNILHFIFLPTVWLLDYLLFLAKPDINFRAKFPLAYNFIIEKPCAQ